MKKLHLIFLVSGALVLGIIIGAVAIGLLSVHIGNRFMGISSAANAGDEIAELRWLRTGDTNGAIELLETHLDGDIVNLGILLGGVSPGRRDMTFMKVLKGARDYWTKYPRKSVSPEGDILIAKAFDLVGSQKSH